MINGQYSDGKTSHVTSAVGGMVSKYFEVKTTSGRFLIREKITLVEISSRLGNVPRTVNFPSGAQFISEDNEAIDKMADEHLGKKNVLYAIERRLIPVIFSAIFALVVCGWLIMEGIPLGAKLVVERLPEELTKAIGAGSIDALDYTLFDSSELAVSKQREVRGLLQPLLKQHSSLGASIHFRSSEGANAFALPDGSTVLTDDLFDILYDDNELIAIVYHELGHLHHRHILRRVLQGSVISILVFLITGDLGNVDLIVGLPTLMADLAYSREFELEADSFAVKSMHEQHISVQHFSSMLQRISAHGENESKKTDDGFFKYFSTHPHEEERIKLVNRYLLESK